MSTTSQLVAGGHAPVLNGLRAVAVLMVIVFHAEAAVSSGGELGELYRQAVGFGWAGVDLFFVLSGFLITLILIQTRGRRTYYTSFYARRALRIFPIYYLLLLAVFVLARPVLSDDPRYQAALDVQSWYWFYLQNWLSLMDGAPWPLAHLWSLAVEEQFYLIWPLVVCLIPLSRLWVACVCCIAMSALFRVLVLALGLDTGVIYFLTLSRLDALAAGALLGCCVSQGWCSHRLNVRLALLVASVSSVAWLLWLQGSTSAWTVFMANGGLTILSLAATGLLYFVVTEPPSGAWHRALSLRPLQYLGKISYGLYLYHWPVMYGLSTFLKWPSGAATHLLFLLTALGLTIGCAAASWVLVEQPILRLKRLVPRPAEERGNATGAAVLAPATRRLAA